MREQGQTSTRESARDILLDWCGCGETRNGTELRYQAGKRQVNEPKAACEQPVIPVHSRKFAGESKANGFRASLFVLGRPAISSREEVVSGWRLQPSRRIRVRVRRNGGEGARGRAGARLQDGRACRSPCVAPNRIADKWRPTSPCKCRDMFSQGSKLRRWKCCGHRP